MSAKLLEVEHLTTRFRSGTRVTYAVNGISFDLDAGETLAFVGESGSGKSVSMLSLLKLLSTPPAEVSARHVIFDGIDIRDSTKEEMRALRGGKVAMIFQDSLTSLNPVLSVGYQIMEPLMVHRRMSKREARRRAEELLHLVGIPEAERDLGNFPHQFSGGMRQRVMIAMALSCDPRLLIADEPTTALDVTIQAQIIELVKSLKARLGMAMIWITHDLGVVAGIADRVNVMYGGLIVESGPVDVIYEDPQHPYTIALLGALPSLDGDTAGTLIPIDGLPPRLSALPVGCPFAARCRHAIGRCHELTPPLEERSPGHRAACWVDPATGTIR